MGNAPVHSGGHERRQGIVGFKEDADFARFVSVGAIGAAAVANHLESQFDHQTIELERYAMANKVWQTKVKRLRLPDLLCVRCGLRVESRAKSKLKIMLSHLDSPGRKWDDGGMRDEDLFAFLLADISQDPPHCGPPIFFTTAALQASISNAKQSAPKAASEGSEITLTWPCWVPGKRGRFVRIDNEDRIVFEGEDGKVQRYWHWRNWGQVRDLSIRALVTSSKETRRFLQVLSNKSRAQCAQATPGTWSLRCTQAISWNDTRRSKQREHWNIEGSSAFFLS